MPAPKATPTVAPPVEHTDFMKPEEAAKDLGCSPRWLRDGANHHGFPHHRLGKFLQFSAQDRAEIRRMCRQPARIRNSRKSTTTRAAA